MVRGGFICWGASYDNSNSSNKTNNKNGDNSSCLSTFDPKELYTWILRQQP